MNEYTVSVFSICAFVGLLSLLCYGSGGTEKTAVSIIAAFVIISPIVTAIHTVNFDSVLDIFSDGGYETDADCTAVAEEAFATGITKAVAEKFNFYEKEVRVKITNFNMEKMSAEQIKITLCGSAALADYRGVEEYVDSFDMGECRVEIEIGKGVY